MRMKCTRFTACATVEYESILRMKLVKCHMEKITFLKELMS